MREQGCRYVWFSVMLSYVHSLDFLPIMEVNLIPQILHSTCLPHSIHPAGNKGEGEKKEKEHTWQ
jgi:hypothetical protein